MEHIIDQLRDSGIRQVNVTTHYQAEKIKGHFGDGRQFGVEMSYVSEDQPLGTAGAGYTGGGPDWQGRPGCGQEPWFSAPIRPQPQIW